MLFRDLKVLTEFKSDVSVLFLLDLAGVPLNLAPFDFAAMFGLLFSLAFEIIGA